MSVDINDAVALRQADTQQLFDQLARCGELYRQGLKQALELPVPTPTSTPASASVSASASSAGGASIHEIVLCSVGGGPVAALRQLSSMLSDTARIPVVLHQGYHMPAYVDAHSLVFIVNYSGGSEEIVSAYRSAIEAGAQVAAITAGGAIAELARERGDLLFMLPAGQIPRSFRPAMCLYPRCRFYTGSASFPIRRLRYPRRSPCCRSWRCNMRRNRRSTRTLPSSWLRKWTDLFRWRTARFLLPTARRTA
ncbi:hypothetical protein ACHHV8_12750 [Paenibacillus sp. TAB 01]|uniref:hypothetical protein n=1 Tax=Paenibacillus sp. TAB 01 TaxID=3368988 RepID=UPI0037513A5E